MDYIYGKLNYEIKTFTYSMLKATVPQAGNFAEYQLTKDGQPVGDKIVIPDVIDGGTF